MILELALSQQLFRKQGLLAMRDDRGIAASIRHVRERGYSDLMVEFLTWAMQTDPSKRASSHELLEHKFLGVLSLRL